MLTRQGLVANGRLTPAVEAEYANRVQTHEHGDRGNLDDPQKPRRRVPMLGKPSRGDELSRFQSCTEGVTKDGAPGRMFDAEGEADRWTRLDCVLARETAQHDASFAGALNTPIYSSVP
jgi:hypothetical protein